jgi:phosphatidylethanolamine-binding protein (PEBP) family uncharacterized protein
MMFRLATTLALSFLGTLVNSKYTNDTVALDIAAIRAHFANAGLVPALLPSFNPSAVMNVAFPGVGTISPGQSLSVQQTVAAPDLTIVLANASVSHMGNFTVVLVDAHVVGTNESNGQVLHWLVNYVALRNDPSCSPSSLSLNVSTAGGVAVTEYVGPQPPEGSGSHRYVILLLPQPPSFSPPANLTKANSGPSTSFHLTDYIWTSHLGQPIAGMYFDVQQGPSNVTVPLTSAVVTSTLNPPIPPSSTVSSSAILFASFI